MAYTSSQIVQAVPTGINSALVLIKTQTIGTTVSSVTVTDAFSSTYDNYLIKISGSSAPVSGSGLQITFNNSTGSTYYWAGNFVAYNGSNTFGGNNNQTSSVIGLTGVNSSTSCEIKVMRPFTTSFTTYNTEFSTSQYAGQYGGFDNNAVSHTGFSIVSGSALTGGNIRIYGYNNGV